MTPRQLAAETTLSPRQAVALLTVSSVGHNEAVSALVALAVAAARDVHGAVEMVYAGCVEMVATLLLADPADDTEQEDRQRCTLPGSSPSCPRALRPS